MNLPSYLHNILAILLVMVVISLILGNVGGRKRP